MKPLLKVLSSGFHPTVQDLGRHGFQDLGVSISGALDPISMRLANALVGNPDSVAGLEIRLLGPTLRVETESVRVALCGTDTTIDIQDGTPCQLPSWRSVMLRLGDVFQIGAIRDSGCCFLAIEGGFDLPDVFGSQSTFVKAGFGGLDGRPLAQGDDLPLHLGKASGRGERRLPNPPLLDTGEPIRVVLGPQDSYFHDHAIATFLDAEYEISKEADRMGLRLLGAPLEHSKGFNISSDGIATGGIQVPGNGLPIILLADHQTTGGYPKIATVASADLPRLGRMRPGETLRFEAVTVSQAEELRRDQESMIEAYKSTLRPAPVPPELRDRFLRSENLISGAVGVRD
jgi:5-oxoprolinase (ATP-hydrolysing) subunit C